MANATAALTSGATDTGLHDARKIELRNGAARRIRADNTACQTQPPWGGDVEAAGAAAPMENQLASLRWATGAQKRRAHKHTRTSPHTHTHTGLQTAVLPESQPPASVIYRRSLNCQTDIMYTNTDKCNGTARSRAAVR